MKKHRKRWQAARSLNINLINEYSIMKHSLKSIAVIFFSTILFSISFAQKNEKIKIVKDQKGKKINVFVGDKLFTSFLYPDTLEKPVLYPVFPVDGTDVTRGFPLHPKQGDPTDHPHHIGIWFTCENVNGLDFWNNSYAIPKEKKHLYGWIRTDTILKTSDGTKGIVSYHANWTNQQKDVLLEETTRLEFSGTTHQRIIDRITVLKADTTVLFTDAKDGLYGIR